MADDLRKLLDPLQAILAARPKYRQVPATEVHAARIEIFVDPESLPGALVTGDGGIDVGNLIMTVQAALGRFADQQLRGVHASQTFTSTLVWNAGDTRRIPLTWTTPPLAPCRYATVRMDVGIVWQGKLSASVEEGSVTDTGCTVVVRASAQVVITLGSPLTVHADGTYVYWPPFGGT